LKVILMPDNKRRDHLEQLLKAQLQKAEENVSNDPEMKNMVTKLREIYLHDKSDFLSALSPAPSPKTNKKPFQLPFSKIPQLLMMIDQIGKKSPHLIPIAPPPGLKNPSAKKTASPSPLDTPKMTSLQIMRQIEKITVEINKANEVYAALKQEEPSIKARQGKYSIPHERLKGERLLRELPTRIHYLSNLRSELNRELDDKYDSK
jgi:hypothetical protein